MKIKNYTSTVPSERSCARQGRAIGDHAGGREMTPREEIEKKLTNLERVREVTYGDFKRIREILTTHELVPIDNTPFDPERCGWSFVNGSWYSLGVELRKFEGRNGLRIVIEDAEGFMWNAPWPATHSDGVRLLQLLGLEVRE